MHKSTIHRWNYLYFRTSASSDRPGLTLLGPLGRFVRFVRFASIIWLNIIASYLLHGVKGYDDMYLQ